MTARLGGLAILLVAFGATGLPAHADTWPKLKPGLWRLTKTEGGGKAVETKCVGEEEGQPTLRGALPHLPCAEPRVTRTASGHTMIMVCAMADLTMTTTATLTGDLVQRMRFDMVMDASGPAVTHGNGPRRKRFSTQAVRLGDCPTRR